MAITTGLNGKLYINTNTVASPTWTFIGGQRSAKLSKNHEATDVTNKGDAGWERSIGTTRSLSIDLEGFVDEADAGFLALADVFWSDLGSTTTTQKQFQFRTPGARTFTGQFNLSKLDEDHPMKDGVGYSASLKSSGVITKA